jgi:predicted RNase H-like nuclease
MERLIQIAGVDGCRGGRWIAVIAGVEDFGKAEVKIFESATALISELAPRTLIAFDIPIGLPERAIAGGREPDWLARAFLGSRRTSVFPVPSRRAVYAYEHGYRKVCTTAQATSDPPKKPSQQAFNIFQRIQEIDVILRQDPALRSRVFEVHPEVSFQVMNNNKSLRISKKIKSGTEIRKKLLVEEGFSRSFLNQSPPEGAGRDDFYDACACAWSAKRILLGSAQVFPSQPPRDSEGLEQAIRV